MSEFLALIIRLIHYAIILFVALAPHISDNPDVLLIHVAGSITLMAHWLMNSDICSLTVLESSLRGIPMQESFMHKIVSPIYDISDETLSKVSWIVTLFNAIISGKKLHNLSEEGVQPQILKLFFPEL